MRGVVAIPEKTEAQKRAQKGYMAKFARVELRMEPEKQKRVQAHAKATGESINAFVNRAIEETIRADEERREDLIKMQEKGEK